VTFTEPGTTETRHGPKPLWKAHSGEPRWNFGAYARSTFLDVVRACGIYFEEDTSPHDSTAAKDRHVAKEAVHKLVEATTPRSCWRLRWT